MKFVRIEFIVPSLEEARKLNEHSFIKYEERFCRGEYYGLPNGNWVFRLERFEDISFFTLALDADMSVRIIENSHHFKVENVKIW